MTLNMILKKEKNIKKGSKIVKGLYWSSTGILSLMMVFSAVSYFANPQMVEIFQHLGFPGYFRIELATAKLAGVTVLLFAPKKKKLLEWAYTGFGITFISAFIAHLNSGDSFLVAMAPVLAFAFLAISYSTVIRVRS